MKYKHLRDCTPEEAAAQLAAIKRGAPAEPPPLPDGQKRAAEMTERERQEWLAEHKRKFQ
jgi:hypothetical protein